MNPQDYKTLLSSLNEAVEILSRNRTPDPHFAAAFDTLKQARAMVCKTIERGPLTPIDCYVELAAA